mmetsp:Transcript_5095/g.9477  ORF Transcript_5095/g.9477 Transcript_5095/m.9477 type:complete len:128 (-) Transcript_5095:160-543(-)
MFGRSKKNYCSFQNEVSLEDRKEKSRGILGKHPHCVPVFLESTATTNPNVTPIQLKVVIEKRITVMHFMTLIRQKVNLEPTTALFYFVGRKHKLTGDQLMGEVYDQYADEDGFLYISCSDQDTMGCI